MTAPLVPPDMEALTRHLTKAAADMNRALAQLGYSLTAQTAFGCAYRGDLDQARTVLANLPTDVLRRVGDAATGLAGVAAGMLVGVEQLRMLGVEP